MSGNEIGSYCREIETYLCRKNDGHLVRVVGPSFDLVSGWAVLGVPLKIAFRGIDRYFERYYRKGPRRRPVRIDFCEADVLETFDEWRRAVGIVVGREPGIGSQKSGVESSVAKETAPEFGVEPPSGRRRHGVSLPEHVERVLLKLTAARAGGRIGPAFDAVLDRVGQELDRVRADARGLRGAAREGALARLAAVDAELLAEARRELGDGGEAILAREADEELAGFRATMTGDAYARARNAGIDRLVRERFNLPVIVYTP